MLTIPVPLFQIPIAGTDRALAANARRWPCPPAGAPEQLWRVDSSDGTYRIMPKAIPNSREPWALSAVGSSFATLAKFDFKSDKQRWNLKMP
jgi:arabinan endo-1,5-alpha-L-arabinosidase